MCINIIEQYKEFLKDPSTYSSYICNQCGYFYDHPLNYCPKCPGRLQKTTITWLERTIRIAKQPLYPYLADQPIVFYREFCRRYGYDKKEFEANYLCVLEEYIKENLLGNN